MPTDVFSQISDGNGHMVVWRFAEYLQEVLALPAAVYESPSFNYTEGLATSIFPGVCSSFCCHKSVVLVQELFYKHVVTFCPKD
jgi:hypothetical protein